MAISYKDRTFCCSKVETHTCGREITEKQIADAKWGNIPIAWGEFCTPKETQET